MMACMSAAVIMTSAFTAFNSFDNGYFIPGMRSQRHYNKLKLCLRHRPVYSGMFDMTCAFSVKTVRSLIKVSDQRFRKINKMKWWRHVAQHIELHMRIWASDVKFRLHTHTHIPITCSCHDGIVYDIAIFNYTVHRALCGQGIKRSGWWQNNNQAMTSL